MILLPDEETHQAILQVLRDLPEEDQNINQTRLAPVKYRPITVNIEVKLPGEGKNDTMVQLTVWAAAQLEKLSALSGTPARIGIPLVSVEGHDWRLYIAYQKDDSEAARRVWGNDAFGNSSSTLLLKERGLLLPFEATKLPQLPFDQQPATVIPHLHQITPP